MDDGSEGSRRAPENEYKLLDSLFTSFGLIGFACVCCVFCRDEWEKDGGEGGECSRVWDFGPEVSSSLAFPPPHMSYFRQGVAFSEATPVW